MALCGVYYNYMELLIKCLFFVHLLLPCCSWWQWRCVTEVSCRTATKCTLTALCTMSCTLTELHNAVRNSHPYCCLNSLWTCGFCNKHTLNNYAVYKKLTKNTAICETSACSHKVININITKICLYALTTHVIINSINKVMHTYSQLLLTSLASAEDFPVYEVMQFFH